MEKLISYLSKSLTAFHAVDEAAKYLDEQGFTCLSETQDWALCEDGKYYVKRGACLLAFTVGALDEFSYKIVASHVDSPALKLKENPVIKSGAYTTLNVETYGGGIWYSFFDRPLKIAGRVIKKEDERILSQTVESPFFVTIPSVAVHQQREVNEKFGVNPQVDLLPLTALSSGEVDCMQPLVGDNAIAYDLFVVNAQEPYSFGVNGEFLASPRIDNLTSAYASLQALTAHAGEEGVCVAALFNREEVGSAGPQGAGGDFLEHTLRRIAYALRFDDNEFYKAIASSFFVSVDNAHAKHPNHGEKSDPTNATLLGGGVVIKAHAGGAYLTDGLSSAVMKTVFDKAGVKYQTFYNRSDMRSGSTLGVCALTRLGANGVDIGLAQLAMHSACECFAKDDYEEMVNGLTAFYSSSIIVEDDGFSVR